MDRVCSLCKKVVPPGEELHGPGDNRDVVICPDHVAKIPRVKSVLPLPYFSHLRKWWGHLKKWSDEHRIKRTPTSLAFWFLIVEAKATAVKLCLEDTADMKAGRITPLRRRLLRVLWWTIGIGLQFFPWRAITIAYLTYHVLKAVAVAARFWFS